MNINNYILIVYGPTGVGKTGFVDSLAQQMPIEIVNCDMGQFYVPLTIGTAKPDWHASTVKHHLFDILSKPELFTVVAYRKKLADVLKKIWSNNNLPVLVGGSAFYIKSLFFPPSAESELQGLDFGNGSWDELNQVDPERAQEIDPKDTYRINRALSIWKETGKKASSFKPAYDPPANYYLLCLTRDRADLYDRINQRVVEMMDAGWLDEVEGLDDSWRSFIMMKKIIGYNELLSYMNDSDAHEYEKIISLIQKRTRNYAKRQMTFWRMLKKKLEDEINNQNQGTNSKGHVAEVNLTSIDLNLYIKHLHKTLKKIVSEE